jgi:hypothetical protein
MLEVPEAVLKTKSVFEDSPIPLDKWLAATWMIANCTNGINSCEIMRAVGVTQETAWFMLHRIRLVVMDDNGNKLSGQIGVDETFVGERVQNMHRGSKLYTDELPAYRQVSAEFASS